MTDVVKKWITDWTAVSFSGTRTLVSLADDEWADLSDELNNTTLGKAIFADFNLVLGSAAHNGADAAVEEYILPAGQGDTYPDWTADGIIDLQEHNNHFVGGFTVASMTAAVNQSLRDVEVPPGKFKVGVRNRTNVALAASGATLYYRLWSHGSA